MSRPARAADPPPDAPLVAALLGNPNTGKSTLFTALCGVPTRIGNYPGVTVEEKVGRFVHAGVAVDLVDLPGTYSLAARSPDERVAVAMLRGELPRVARPECVVVVVDATNLERNCYLVAQVLALGLPTVVALTLTDVAATEGLEIDDRGLAARLGCPVVRVVAPRQLGLDELRGCIVAARGTTPPPAPDLARHLARTGDDRPAAAREAIARYDWIDRMLAGIVRRATGTATRPRHPIDRLLTHRLWGTLTFAAVMLAVFSSIFWLAAPIMDLVSAIVDATAGWVGDRLPPGAFRDLVVDGVFAGVGGVVVFVPQIAILFLFIAVLEGCGYLARAAYLMDRLLVGVGLSGKSFIPLLSSFACAIPGIMSARTIENRRDRLLTILVAPLMSCSARLPVYLLMCAAFVPDVAVGTAWLRLPAVVLASMYALGVAVAAIVAWVLSRTVFRGPPQPFVMELPAWRWPQPAVVLERAREASWSFLVNAGTLILAVSIVVWVSSNYPRSEAALEADLAAERAALEARLADPATGADDRADTAAELALFETPEGLAVARRGAIQRQSLLGRAGRLVEPLVRPLGWDWRLGCAAIASFPAREVVLGTLSVLYNLPPGDDDGTALERRLRAARWAGTNRPVFTLPVALSLMVFFALCAQCASTLVVIGRETGSWLWPVVTFTYMTVLAWLAACVTYQAASAWGL